MIDETFGSWLQTRLDSELFNGAHLSLKDSRGWLSLNHLLKSDETTYTFTLAPSERNPAKHHHLVSGDCGEPQHQTWLHFEYIREQDRADRDFETRLLIEIPAKAGKNQDLPAESITLTSDDVEEIENHEAVIRL